MTTYGTQVVFGSTCRPNCGAQPLFSGSHLQPIYWCFDLSCAELGSRPCKGHLKAAMVGPYSGSFVRASTLASPTDRTGAALHSLSPYNKIYNSFVSDIYLTQSPPVAQPCATISTPHPIAVLLTILSHNPSRLTGSFLAMAAYSTLNSSRNIRILRLHPAKDRAAPLHCTLEEIPIDDAKENPDIQYDALSYVWGHPQDRLIFCHCGDSTSTDTITVKITQNCGTALLSLRDKRQTITLWVDAICIDQSSIIEKNVQVPLMRDVYMNARKVLIWFGDESKDVTASFRKTQKYSRHLKLGKGFWTRRFSRQKSFRHLVISMIGIIPPGGDAARLILHPWLHRVWTAQELILSRHPVVVHGKAQLDWALFKIWYEEIRLVVGRRTSELPHYWDGKLEYMSWSAIQWRSKIYDWWWGSGINNLEDTSITEEVVAQLMFKILLNKPQLLATDARDEVYGLYGLLMLPGIGQQLPPVDYSRPAGAVFRELTLLVIRLSRRLDIIVAKTEEGTNRGIRENMELPKPVPESLPSWAKNWQRTVSYPRWYPESGSSNTIWVEATRKSRIPKEDLPSSPLDRELRMKGKILGSIKSVGVPLTMEESWDIEVVKARLASWIEMLLMDHHLVVGGRENEEDEELGRKLGEALIEVLVINQLSRTQADPRHTREDESQEFLSYIFAFLEEEILPHLGRTTIAGDSQQSWQQRRPSKELQKKMCKRIATRCIEHKLMQEVAEDKLGQLADLSLFTTDDSRLVGLSAGLKCIGQEGEIQSGDLVALVVGCDAPFILRRTPTWCEERREYYFKGLAYMSGGVMLGEMWGGEAEEPQLERMVLADDDCMVDASVVRSCQRETSI